MISQPLARSLVLFMIVCANSLFAQTSFNWLDGNSYDSTVTPSAYTELKLEFSNETNDTLNMGIKVMHNNLPLTWDGMVCVYGKCLGSIPAVGDSATMIAIDTADIGYVRLTVNPFNGNEVATLKIWTYNLDDPTDGDTATWHMDQSSIGLLEEVDWHSIAPNPAQDFLDIEGESHHSVKLYSADGTLVLRSEGVGRIPLQGLKPGSYVVVIEDVNGQLHTEIIIKQ